MLISLIIVVCILCLLLLSALLTIKSVRKLTPFYTKTPFDILLDLIYFSIFALLICTLIIFTGLFFEPFIFEIIVKRH